MLQLEGVSKRYSDSVALQPIDLDVGSGDTTVLLGPSGCGKSTLLRLMNGLILPDTGLVRFEGQLVDEDSVSSLRQRMGYVIQEGGLFPHLTAERNASLMATYLGWSASEITSRIRELAALTRMPSDVLDRYPAQLSGGQRQRVSLIRALMLDPDLLLLDEPLAALDPIIRFDLQEDLRRIFRTLGKTVVLVTHDVAEAAFFGDHLVLLDHGTIVQQGEFNDLVNHPADEIVSHFLSAHRRAASVSSPESATREEAR